MATMAAEPSALPSEGTRGTRWKCAKLQNEKVIHTEQNHTRRVGEKVQQNRKLKMTLAVDIAGRHFSLAVCRTRSRGDPSEAPS